MKSDFGCGRGQSDWGVGYLSGFRGLEFRGSCKALT